MAEISQTADRALAVLIELGDRGPTPPAELARTLGLSRTVVHRLLTTLMYRGFVVRHSDGYVPGLLVSRIAGEVQTQVRHAALPVMERLADAISETIIVYIPDAEQTVVLDQVVASVGLIRVERRLGTRRSLTDGAGGQAILAYLDTPVVERIVRSAEDPDGLRRQLEIVRKLGYARSHDEFESGVAELAVPIQDMTGHTVASLAIVVPSMRAQAMGRHAGALTVGAGRIGRHLRTGTRRRHASSHTVDR